MTAGAQAPKMTSPMLVASLRLHRLPHLRSVLVPVASGRGMQIDADYVSLSAFHPHVPYRNPDRELEIDCRY